MQQLQVLTMRANKLTALPPDLCNMVALVILDLIDNPQLSKAAHTLLQESLGRLISYLQAIQQVPHPSPSPPNTALHPKQRCSVLECCGLECCHLECCAKSPVVVCDVLYVWWPGHDLRACEPRTPWTPSVPGRGVGRRWKRRAARAGIQRDDALSGTIPISRVATSHQFSP